MRALASSSLPSARNCLICFDKFDLSHALEGEGSESFGHGVYVTNSSKIGREYAQRAKNRKMADLYKNMRYPDGVKGDIFKRRLFGEMVNDVAYSRPILLEFVTYTP